MFGQTNFYHAIIKKSIATFGSIFNNIYINRESDTVVNHIKVPLTYGPKDKMLTHLRGDPNLDKQAAVVLPAISFEIVTITPNRQEKLCTLQKIVKKDETNYNKLLRQYTAVPYIITFRLHIISKNVEDGNKILEQILPYFTPDWTPTVELVPEMDENRDTPITLQSIALEDNYEDDFKKRREVIWTLNFSLKTWFYGPIQPKPIIKFAIIDFAAGELDADVYERQTTTPGLTAEGTPTSNTVESINVTLIPIDADYGYCNTLEDI